jgi:two-component system response regulator FixJ
MQGAGVVAVLDDDPISRMILEAAVNSDGFTAMCFSVPQQLLDYLEAHRPICILLDMNMPQMSGVEVQCRLRSMGSDVPVIMVSGDSDVPTATAALHNGAVDFICKPIDSKELLHRILEAISLGHRKAVGRLSTSG